MIPPAALAAVLLTPLSPATASTGSAWSQSTTVEGVFRNWVDDEDTELLQEDFLDGMSRVYAVVTRPGLELGVQVDGAAAWPNDRAGLVNERTPPPGWKTGLLFDSDEAVRVALEKKFGRWRNDDVGLAVEVGDAYRALGRGLAFSLVKNTELDIDTSIEGGAFDYAAGPFEIGGWAGQSNPQTISTTFINRIIPDIRDEIGGGRVAITTGPVQLFGHANTIHVDPEIPGSVFLGEKLVFLRNAVASGGGVSIPDFAGGDLYVEGTWVQYRVSDAPITTPRDASGRGFYGAASFYPGRFTLQVEGKHYVNLEMLNVRQAEGTPNPFDYSTPPTLEKENLVNPNRSEALNSNHITGVRTALSARVGSMVVRGTVAAFRDLGHRRDIYDANEDIVHGYATWERRTAGSFWQVTGGYRHEVRREDADDTDRQAHVDADVLVPIGSVQLEAKALAYRQWEVEPISGEKIEYDTVDVVASVRPLRWLALAVFAEYTTDEAMLSGLLRREGNIDHNTFGAFEVAIDPMEGSTVRAFLGATKGGLKCSGGTCRVVPAFEGGRLEWLARF